MVLRLTPARPEFLNIVFSSYLFPDTPHIYIYIYLYVHTTSRLKLSVLIDLALAKIKSRTFKEKLSSSQKKIAKKSELIIQGARDNVSFGNAVKTEETLQAGRKQHACSEGKPLK